MPVFHEPERQLLLDGSHACNGEVVIRELLRIARKRYPEENRQLWIQYAFLMHEGSLNFLSPVLEARYAKPLPDTAKEPTLAWLRSVGTFESYARGARDVFGEDEYDDGPPLPDWYNDYIKTSHFQEVKQQAFQYWRSVMGDVRCIDNSDHELQEWHHRNYKSLGLDGESKDLVPKCRDCHRAVRKTGPRVNRHECPKEVKQWL